MFTVYCVRIFATKLSFLNIVTNPQAGLIGSKDLLISSGGTSLAGPSPMPAESYAYDSNTDDIVNNSTDSVESKSGADIGMRRLRKAVITRFGSQTIDRLKMYVAVPVLRKIEEEQPLEYLSEMRQVKNPRGALFATGVQSSSSARACSCVDVVDVRVMRRSPVLYYVRWRVSRLLTKVSLVTLSWRISDPVSGQYLGPRHGQMKVHINCKR